MLCARILAPQLRILLLLLAIGQAANIGAQEPASVDADEYREVIWNLIANRKTFQEAYPSRVNRAFEFTYTWTNTWTGSSHGSRAVEFQEEIERQKEYMLTPGASAVLLESSRALIAKLEFMIENNLSGYVKEKANYYALGSNARKDFVDLLYLNHETPARLDPAQFQTTVWKRGEPVRHLSRINRVGTISRPEPPPIYLERVLLDGIGYPKSSLFGALIEPLRSSDSARNMMEEVRRHYEAGDEEALGRSILSAALDSFEDVIESLGERIQILEVSGAVSPLYEVSISLPQTGGLEVLLVDPSKGYIVTDLKTSDDGRIVSHVFGEYFEADPASGFFFPRTITSRTFGDQGELLTSQTFEGIRSIRLASNIDREELLTLTFPEGTNVTDFYAGLSFTVPELGEFADRLDEIISYESPQSTPRALPVEENIETPPPPNDPIGVPEKGIGRVLVVLGIVILLATIVYNRRNRG